MRLRILKPPGSFLPSSSEQKDREHFVVLHLDGRNRVISVETVSVGTLNAALVHPREVWKGAYLANANAIVCGHNHPSGDLTPSFEDAQLLERLKKAGELLGVAIVDFLIVSGTSFRSMMF
ncbi:MAG: JAB domain-containing protein [Planctomycetota bacterium]